MSSDSSVIAERLGLGDGVHELKLGKSFRTGSTSSPTQSSSSSSQSRTNGKNSPANTSSSSISSKSFCDGISQTADAYHTIRYDFKPVSVDTSKKATIEFGEGNSVTVTAPNTEGSGHCESVFTGSRKPHMKECVLIIDRETGEIRLERLSDQITVKQTRVDSRTSSQQSKPSPTENCESDSSDSGDSSSSSSSESSPSDNEDQSSSCNEESDDEEVEDQIVPLPQSQPQPQNNSSSLPSMPQFSQLSDLTSADLELSESSSMEDD